MAANHPSDLGIRRRDPPVDALLDTGATISIAPLEIAEELGIALDLDDALEAHVAGGGTSVIYASPSPINCTLYDPDTHTSCRWQMPLFFSPGQRLMLLGHHQCLEKFDVTFRGQERALEMTALFAKDTTEGPPRRRR